VGHVDDVDQDPGRLGLGPGAGVCPGVAAGVDHDPGAGQRALGIGGGGQPAHVGAGLGQQGGLLLGQRALADHDRGLPVEV